MQSGSDSEKYDPAKTYHIKLNIEKYATYHYEVSSETIMAVTIPKFNHKESLRQTGFEKAIKIPFEIAGAKSGHNYLQLK